VAGDGKNPLIFSVEVRYLMFIYSTLTGLVKGFYIKYTDLSVDPAIKQWDVTTLEVHQYFISFLLGLCLLLFILDYCCSLLSFSSLSALVAIHMIFIVIFFFFT
jgi:hypothetical protein